ncbi:serglycin-like [Camellia sinensis]|uniref:serglycin-like n=1 Tax=Camellia sinensis TaxID=4442 RepID=UPI001035A924|nr:serglycin-like [Camellia sinensis]
MADDASHDGGHTLADRALRAFSSSRKRGSGTQPWETLELVTRDDDDDDEFSEDQEPAGLQSKSSEGGGEGDGTGTGTGTGLGSEGGDDADEGSEDGSGDSSGSGSGSYLDSGTDGDRSESAQPRKRTKRASRS